MFKSAIASTPRRKRKEVRERGGRNLMYKVGREGRKTGVKRKEYVVKDADDLDNVDDFFASDSDEEYFSDEDSINYKNSNASVSHSPGLVSPITTSTMSFATPSSPFKRNESGSFTPAPIDIGEVHSYEAMPFEAEDMNLDSDEDEPEEPRTPFRIKASGFKYKKGTQSSRASSHSSSSSSSSHSNQEVEDRMGDLRDEEDSLRDKFSTMTVSQLRNLCKKYRISASGKKTELAQRLSNYEYNKRLESEEEMSMEASHTKKRTGKRKANDRKMLLAEEYEEDLAEEPGEKGRSRRITAQKPVKFWKNESVIYGRRSSGTFPTIVGVKRVEDDNEVEPPVKRAKSAKPSKTVVYDKATVFNWATSEDIKYSVVKSDDQLKWNGIGAQLKQDNSSAITISRAQDTFDDVDVQVAYSFDESPLCTSGVITIGPESATPSQNSKDSMEMFYVVSGTPEVTIYKSHFNVKKGSHFFIPPRNRFAISNRHKKNPVKLVFYRRSV